MLEDENYLSRSFDPKQTRKSPSSSPVTLPRLFDLFFFPVAQRSRSDIIESRQNRTAEPDSIQEPAWPGTEEGSGRGTQAAPQATLPREF